MKSLVPLEYSYVYNTYNVHTEKDYDQPTYFPYHILVFHKDLPKELGRSPQDNHEERGETQYEYKGVKEDYPL